MFVVQDRKLTTVIIWVSTIVIFLLLALLALMGGILYSKQRSGDVQVNILPGVSAEAEKVTAPAAVPPQPQTQARVAQAAPAGAGGEKIYVLINGKLVPLELNAINKLAQEDSDIQQAQAAARKAREVVAAETVTIDEQTAKKAVAHAGGKHEHVTTGDGNKVVLTQAKYGRGLQSQLQLMGMAAADLIQRNEGEEQDVKTLVSEAEKTKKKMRYVRVKPGDSLWSIAVRAYGSGFKYTRILEANPQIKNPNRLETGMLLRVPL